jgi:transporter family-2 protein
LYARNFPCQQEELVTWIFLIWALIAGCLFPLQAGVNSQLSDLVNHPMRATLISFTVGFIVLLIYSFFIRRPWPPAAHLVKSPWWIWTGGLYGVVIVATTIMLAPRLGAALYISLMITGQMTASVLFDQFGAVGFEQHPASLLRLLGVGMLIGGVVLIRLF